MRTFVLIRSTDVTGVSGTGKVAEGAEFTDGTVAMRWITGVNSTGFYSSVEDVKIIHGHDGATQIQYTSGGIVTGAQST